MPSQLDLPVAQLTNIGKTVADRLATIGVHTRRDLARLGAPAAYRALKNQRPDVTLPVCYYLYSLDAALRDIHWDDLSDRRKTSLRRAAGLPK